MRKQKYINFYPYCVGASTAGLLFFLYHYGTVLLVFLGLFSLPLLAFGFHLYNTQQHTDNEI